MTGLPRLLLVTDRRQTAGRRLEHVVARCVEAGFRHVLLRERDLPLPLYDELLDRVLHEVGYAAKVFTREPRPHTPGCHLGERASLPADQPAIIGRSVHDEDGLRRAAIEGVDYVLAGPFAFTASKPGYGPTLGLAGVRELLRLDKRPPLLAIGGVRPADAAPLAALGAHGLAVMGPLMRAARPAAVAAEYVAAARASWPHS